jgi:murein DD-endopeptidase MepM/ murein hydrolase activator NlpD
MAAKRYKFNPTTEVYEVITLPFQVRFYRFLRHVLIAFLFASLVTMLFSYFFYTPKMRRIVRERDELLLQYEVLNSRVGASAAELAEIRGRDRDVYRSLLVVDTLIIEGVDTPYPEAKYASFAADRYAPLIGESWHALDALGRQLYAASRSLDELGPLVLSKERMAERIPAIWPVDIAHVRNIYSYGRRTDPVTGVKNASHKGMDFSGDRGEPIYATGNGTVVVPVGTSGYGLQVMIDHGFGYRTRYGHLSKILVEPGQQVVRGEQIAEMGNTGKSTGTHLHYEVIFRGAAVNPVSYFSMEMADADFQSILASARETTFDQNFEQE